MFPIILVALFSIFATYYYLKNRRFYQCLQGMPQPPSYPIIGNLFELVNSPERMFTSERERAKKYPSIYRLDVFTLTSINISNPDDIEIVLTDMKQNEKSVIYNLLHNWLGTGLLTSKGLKWQNRRKILTPAFHFNILQEFIKIFVTETEQLVQDLKKMDEIVDVVVPITHFTLLAIGETAMGINLDALENDKSSYKDAIYKMGEVITKRGPRPWLHNDTVFAFTKTGQLEKELVKTLHTFSGDVIAERKKNVQGSYSSRKRLAMLDLLLKYREEGASIDDEGIREEVDTFMFEGHDTTSMAICFTLMLLANHKEFQEEVRKEIEEVLGDQVPSYSNLHELKITERFIKESLRMYPSVPFISRMSGSEFGTKTGYTIPKGCMVNIHIYDLHHNPRVFPDPEKFDPDRFLPENSQDRHPFAYIPFSAGSRNCIGQKFAMLEIKTALCGILKKFVLEPVDGPEDIVFIADLVLRPKGSIRVKFVPRK